MVCDKGVNAFENGIDGLVPVAADPPAFDDAGVIAMYDDVAAIGEEARDGCNKEFESDGFSPRDVTLSVPHLPAWEESPSSPAVADDDANADARASIRERVKVEEHWGR